MLPRSQHASALIRQCPSCRRKAVGSCGIAEAVALTAWDLLHAPSTTPPVVGWPTSLFVETSDLLSAPSTIAPLAVSSSWSFHQELGVMCAPSIAPPPIRTREPSFRETLNVLRASSTGPPVACSPPSQRGGAVERALIRYNASRTINGGLALTSGGPLDWARRRSSYSRRNDWGYFYEGGGRCQGTQNVPRRDRIATRIAIICHHFPPASRRHEGHRRISVVVRHMYVE